LLARNQDNVSEWGDIGAPLSYRCGF
jgi:hypothetical protein